MVGLSFHAGSQTNSAARFRTAVTRSLAVIDEVRTPLGRQLEVLDIDGGLPAAYRDDVCDAADHVMPTVTVGDHVISPMMGAYTLVTACAFNGLPPPAVAVVHHDGTETPSPRLFRLQPST